MNEKDIELISKSNNSADLTKVLEEFLKNSQAVFSFPKLNENNNRVILWTALFQHLQNDSPDSIQNLCLSAVRVLSRDKDGLDKLLCEKWITVLIEKSGLYNFVTPEEVNTQPPEMSKKDILLEASKCLCNIAYNSEVARALCAHTSIAQALVGRLKSFMNNPFRNQVILYDVKLLFILTAFRADIRNKVKHDLNGLYYLTDALGKIVEGTEGCQNKISLSENNGSSVAGIHCYYLQENVLAVACEILKAQFNLAVLTDTEKNDDNCQENVYAELMPILTRLLCSYTSDKAKTMDLHSHVGNILTCVPAKYFSDLTPELKSNDVSSVKFSGRNMDALKSLVELLRFRLIQTTAMEQQFEELSPILTVMVRSARSSRLHRRYLRAEVLPPLRDVSTPPERGDTLRNMLCKLLTTPISRVRDLVAEFLFVLCKEKVGRMVKYTGFGNAAGHLAQRGLMGRVSGVGGEGADGDASSSSGEDSDTEEYLQAQPHIDPVVGCTRPPRPNPMEGMSEEQKEYEAMKLVKLFDEMMAQGVVKPARVGPDGRPQPVEHVLELRENHPTRPQS